MVISTCFSFALCKKKAEREGNGLVYKLINDFGGGGISSSAQDAESGDKVAIKKIPRAFEDLVDAKRILREIKLLKHFNHENVSLSSCVYQIFLCKFFFKKCRISSYFSQRLPM